MKIHKLKSLASRGTSLAAAVSLATTLGISAVFPAMASADALNPLTDRTLLLTSSSPGWNYLDGSGNPTYAPPGSGPNGKQTGEQFSFKTSTDSSTSPTIKAFTFQYCTAAAGQCTAPGDDSGNKLDATPDRGTDTSSTSDLSINYPTPAEVSILPAAQSDGSPLVAPDDSQGNFAVIVNGALSSGWTMTVTNKEDSTVTQTGKNNFVTLTNSTGGINPGAQTPISVVFYATNNNYITNPGSKAFFVKINDFDFDSNTDDGTYPNFDGHEIDPTFTYNGNNTPHLVDGGVTVANVMTNSIEIQTKVLETMSFSVGTDNPDADAPVAGATHGSCDSIKQGSPIKLGDPTQEYSLSTTKTYDGISYWRLSSNSSNGASVYYSGVTLSNTENDQIAPIGPTAALSHPGEEQFGLAFDTRNYAGTSPAPATPYLNTADQASTTIPAATNGETPSPLIPRGQGSGSELHNYSSGGDTTLDWNDAGTDLTSSANTSYFAFDPSSLSTPELIASENTSVVDCSTGIMRYIANISPSTPAGVYTTKINYLAAPEY